MTSKNKVEKKSPQEDEEPRFTHGELVGFVLVAAVFPFVGWAAVLFVPEGPVWAVGDGVPSRAVLGSVAAFVIVLTCVQLPKPWTALAWPAAMWTGGAWIAWIPTWVWRVLFDWAPPLWVAPALLLGHAVVWWWLLWRYRPRREVEDDEEPEPEPPRRVHASAVGERVDYGPAVEYGHDDGPAPVVAPRQARLVTRPEHANMTTDTDDEGPGSLAEQAMDAWPRRANGDPYKNVHLRDLAQTLGVREGTLADDLDAAGVAVSPKLSARPLGQPGAKPTGRPGITWASLQDWVDATADATA